MEFHLICLVALLGIALGDICPSPTDLEPCTCDREGVNCMEAKSVADIKKAFRANFKYGGIRTVWVQGTPITDLPADTFGTIKCREFYVEVNALTSVDLNAFRASKKTVNYLSVFGNKLADFPYSQIDDFEALNTLNLGRNKFETIPNNAFSSKSLAVLLLAQNQIKTIGLNAFANLPSLTRLELSSNQISTLGAMSLAMKQHSPELLINLENNTISDISGSAFQGVDPQVILISKNKLTSLKKDPFETLIVKTAQKGGFIKVSENPLSCQGCDYSWIVLNKYILGQAFVGFTCADGKTLQDLTRQSIGCH